MGKYFEDMHYMKAVFILVGLGLLIVIIIFLSFNTGQAGQNSAKGQNVSLAIPTNIPTQSAQQVLTKSYSDSFMTLKYPDAWTISEIQKPNGGTGIVIKPDEQTDEKPLFEIQIENSADLPLIGVTNSFEIFKYAKKATTVGNIPAVSYSGTTVVGSTSLQETGIAFSKSFQGRQITVKIQYLYNNSKKDAQLESTFQHIVASIRLKS